MKYIIAIGIFQALVAIMLLFKNKLKNGADGILILLVACIATHLLIKFFIFNFIGDEHVRLQMNTFLGFCYGPLLYLYSKKLEDPKFIPGTKWYVFIPFLLAMMAYFSVASALMVAPAKAYVMLDWYNTLTFYCLIPSNIIYSLLAIQTAKLLGVHQFREVKLVQQIGYAFIVMCIIGFSFAIRGHVGYQLNIFIRSLCYSIFILQCVLILRYRFQAIQAGQFQTSSNLDIKEITIGILNPAVVESDAASLQIEPTEAKKTTLSSEEQAAIWHQLETQMNTTKTFTDGALNLDKLAELTGINKYHISETLNNYARKSFYQYINEYRIQYAIEQMKYLTEKGISINILSLAYDAGFNAKSSFNRYFKEITQQTPSEYIKSLQIVVPLDNLLNGALG